MRSIDPVLLSKIKEQNQTIYNNANPKMSIQVSRAKSTVMDSSYWTVETIRQKEGLGDISVAPRRFKPNGPPNRIYEIHVDNGIVGTTIREYPDKMKEGWKDQFTLGPGSAVAIAFDGEWERYRKLWRLVTHEKPWIFWVDDIGDLYTQYWDDEGTKTLLASNVVYCRAIRAWKTLLAEDRDQGIVIGYIKTDGKVYYRQYIQYQDLSYSWGLEYQIEEITGTAVSLNLFITNDFRMGFVVSDNEENIYWYITNRNYSAMTTEIDTVKMGISFESAYLEIGEIETLTISTDETIGLESFDGFSVFNIYESSDTPTSATLTATSGKIIGAKEFEVYFNYPIYTWIPSRLKEMIGMQGVIDVTISGKTMTITTDFELDTSGITVNLGGGLIVGIVDEKHRDIYAGGTVNVLGSIEVSETINMSLMSSGMLTVYEITKHTFEVYPRETVVMGVSLNNATFTINEASTDPV